MPSRPSSEPGPAGVASRGGVLFIDGAPRFLLAADYPYYRDDASHWRARLEAQREAGYDVVTCYVPWRHHAPADLLRGERPDLTGRTRPDRDLAGFLDLVGELGLHALVKPGPFVHGELPFGGLPEYVKPSVNPAIEPELDATGAPIRWTMPRVPAAQEGTLPAPFGHAYVAYACAWLREVARVVAPRVHPRGPVVGIQLMNEGIYSDSARADPRQLGYAVSTIERFHRFLEAKYGSLDAYNTAHAVRLAAWAEIDPPRAATTLPAARALLRYLDWSEFQSGLYLDAASLYRKAMLDGGVAPGVPMFLNFNANGNTYRDRPASNDGWYTRVAALAHTEEFTPGTTNWLGVVAGDEAACRQYLMAVTAFRGPGLEQNWGFSSQYYAPYELVAPSHFETMLSVAAGATGAVLYTFAGTRAWRGNPDLDDGAVPPRTNDHGGATSGDYPGDSPIRSDGARSPKYWTASQLAQYVASEAPGFLERGPRATVAWALYPPYAWAGQWLPRGDPDDVLWRPPLHMVPRGAYHGLDAFVEMMLRCGGAFSQLDVSREAPDPDAQKVVCVSAHDFMDARSQERLARYVETGGHLLLTGPVPDRDERLCPLDGALARRLFPHRAAEDVRLESPRRVDALEGCDGVALEAARVVEAPPDAEEIAWLGGRTVGYLRRVGAGAVAYLGFGPWRARWSQDDRRVAEKNQALVWAVLERLAGERILPARPLDAGGAVSVWQHGPEAAATQHLFVSVRELQGAASVAFTHGGGAPGRARIWSPSQSMQAFAAGPDGPRACYLKGVNDLRAEAVPPRVEVEGRAWAADAPCDLCVVPGPRGLRVSVAHVQGAAAARVRLEVGRRVVELDVPDLAQVGFGAVREVDLVRADPRVGGPGSVRR